jgi:ELWxxDGT repeat protein
VFLYFNNVGKLVFSGNDGIGGRQLWTRDLNGVVSQVGNINAGGGSDPAGLGSLGTITEAFAANDGSNGRELWLTNGTTVTLVKDIYVGFRSSDPIALTVVSSTLYFSADAFLSGRGLWRSDGTLGGTSLVADINPGIGNSSPQPIIATSSPTQTLTIWNGALYFTANDGSSGRELWKYNFVNPPVRVADIYNGAGSSLPANFVISGTPTLFFAADDGVHGRELWKTDGTLTGTVMISDINPFGDSNPSLSGVVGGMLLFSADDGTNGREYRTSDGTPAGTQLLKDIYPGLGDGSPTLLDGPFGGEFYFTAIMTTTGREL